MYTIKPKIGLLFSLLVISLAALDVGAESYLNPGASQAEVLRALKSTRSIGKKPIQRAKSRSSRSSSKGQKRSIQRPSKSSKKYTKRSRKGKQAKPGKRAVARQSLPPSAADPEAGPASFRLQFRFNSAQLDPKTVPFLDTIGEVLQREELKGLSFIVEGHTDASGAEAHNRDLSQRRAEVVRSYLMEKHGIDGKRLAVRGMGESRPMNGKSPYDAINRRVTFSAPEKVETERSVSEAIPAAPEGS